MKNTMPSMAAAQEMSSEDEDGLRRQNSFRMTERCRQVLIQVPDGDTEKDIEEIRLDRWFSSKGGGPPLSAVCCVALLPISVRNSHKIVKNTVPCCAFLSYSMIETSRRISQFQNSLLFETWIVLL